MSLAKIPVTNEPQYFQIALAGKDYICTCRYNYTDEAGWILDFADADSNESIVSNIPLVTGVDLLDGLEYLGFGGKMYVKTDGDNFSVPTLENLGVESFLYFEAVDG
jgi:hypothetical protein